MAKLSARGRTVLVKMEHHKLMEDQDGPYERVRTLTFMSDGVVLGKVALAHKNVQTGHMVRTPATWKVVRKWVEGTLQEEVNKHKLAGWRIELLDGLALLGDTRERERKEREEQEQLKMILEGEIRGQ